MNRVLRRKQKALKTIVGVLIYCMAVFPVMGSTSWSAPAPAGKAAELSAEEKQQLVQQGVEQYKQGQREEAQKKLELAATVFPENYAVPYYLGLIYLEQGKRTAAINQWQQYVQMDPKSDTALSIRKNLTILLHQEAQESAKLAVANEAALVRETGDNNTVAITAFKNMGSENITPLGKGMAALLIHDISQVPDLQVVERVKLQAMLEEMKLGTSGLVTSDSAPRVGKLLKAKHVTSGSLADLDKESLQIASVVMDADQMDRIGTQEAQGQLNQFYALEKDIACQIIEDLDRNCDEAPAAFHQIHTQSLAALILFGIGLNYLDQQQYDEARDSFQKALEEDPSFELAEKALLDTPLTSEAAAATTDKMVAAAAGRGVSADAAGTAIALGSVTASDAAKGVGILPTAGVIGGVAVLGIAAAGGGGGNGSSSSDSDDNGTVITGQCDEQQVSGGDIADRRLIDMGQSSGVFNFYYETYSIKDQIIVTYEGGVLLDTGCVGATDTVPLSYSGSSTDIQVEVIPNCDDTTGTAWTYTVYCPTP